MIFPEVCACGLVEDGGFAVFAADCMPDYIFVPTLAPLAHEIAHETPRCECSGVSDGDAEVRAFLNGLLHHHLLFPKSMFVLVASDQNPHRRVTTAQHAQDLYSAKRRVQEWLFAHGADVRVDAYLLIRAGDGWRCEHLT